MPREFKRETASGGVRGIRRRKGAGFSSEIETVMTTTVALVCEDDGLSQSRKLSFSEEGKPHLAAC